MISAVIYYTFTDDYLPTFAPNKRWRDEDSSREEKIIMNDDTFVHNIQLAVATNLSAPNFKAL